MPKIINDEKFIFYFLIIFVSLSCSKEEFNVNDFPQKWVLGKTTGQIPNSEAFGEDMEWQEYYLLNSDGTFLKHRQRDGISYNAYGNFIFSELTEGRLLELTYDSNYEIIGSCYGNHTEGWFVVSK